MASPGRFRELPSVASILDSREARALAALHPRAVVVAAVRSLLELFRRDAAGAEAAARTRADWTALLLARLPDAVRAREELSLRPVINATGVVVHTNLGRAPLAAEAVEAICAVARGYANLEYDLSAGMRSKRLVHVEEAILGLSGAECAHVVNNNAAAVLLCLAGLARGREVVVSRGELVEIGGSFRIPDIMAESGARLVEVGTTNRTRLEDYERAITSGTALLLKVHRSNFRLLGFTEEVRSRDLAALGERRGIPVVEDLGSGALFDFGEAGIPGTPTLAEALREGPGIVTVSGDKLLGGPQAGIIAGKRSLVEPLKRHPLSRALRIDKLCLAGLAATLSLYADMRRARERVPAVRMITDPEAVVRARARRLVRRVERESGKREGVLALERDVSSPGGGAMPEVEIPTACVAVTHPRLGAAALEERLRKGKTPVVGRVARGKLLLDMRTVRDEEVPSLATALREALSD